jgi:hypothetical protein
MDLSSQLGNIRKVLSKCPRLLVLYLRLCRGLSLTLNLTLMVMLMSLIVLDLSNLLLQLIL